MKLRDIVLHVCFNRQHLRAYMYEFLKNQVKDGAVILKQTQSMAIIGEEEHIFKTEEELVRDGLCGMEISRTEGFVPAHLHKRIQPRIKR